MTAFAHTKYHMSGSVDSMSLCDSATNEPVLTVDRADGVWLVDGTPYADRNEAIAAMVEAARVALGVDGLAVFVPTPLRELG